MFEIFSTFVINILYCEMKNNSNNIKLGSSPQTSQKKIDAAKRNFEQGGSDLAQSIYMCGASQELV